MAGDDEDRRRQRRKGATTYGSCRASPSQLRAPVEGVDSGGPPGQGCSVRGRRWPREPATNGDDGARWSDLRGKRSEASSGKREGMDEEDREGWLGAALSPPRPCSGRWRRGRGGERGDHGGVDTATGAGKGEGLGRLGLVQAPGKNPLALFYFVFLFNF